MSIIKLINCLATSTGLFDDNHEYYRAVIQVQSSLPSSQQSQLPSRDQVSSNTLTTGASDVPLSGINQHLYQNWDYIICPPLAIINPSDGVYGG